MTANRVLKFYGCAILLISNLLSVYSKLKHQTNQHKMTRYLVVKKVSRSMSTSCSNIYADTKHCIVLSQISKLMRAGKMYALLTRGSHVPCLQTHHKESSIHSLHVAT